MHRHLLLAQFDQQAFRESQDTRLGDIVIAHRRPLHQGRHRSDVDDPPLAAFKHRQERLAALDHAHQVDRQLPLPVFQRQFTKETARGHTGIVDDHIDAAELLFAGLGQGGQLAVVAHVATLHKTLAASLAHQRQGFAQACLVDVSQGQAPALARPAQGDLAAQTRAGSGNHDAVVHGGTPCSASGYERQNSRAEGHPEQRSRR
ncbi:hypothetical protein D3C78_718770 [compost metagenome]